MKRLKTAALLLMAAAVSGCAGVDSAGLSPRDGANAQSTATAQNRTRGTATAALPSVTSARVQFAPVIGAPTEAVQPLSARLSSSAGERGLTVTREAEGATLLVKGYFSTISENGYTSVIYVWDVLDPAGNRLHRIQGQMEESSRAGEGWSAVTPATMEAIAERTIDALVTWLSASPA